MTVTNKRNHSFMMLVDKIFPLTYGSLKILVDFKMILCIKSQFNLKLTLRK